MWGSLYYYYSTPKQPYATITHVPFTPVELHRGCWARRIITAVPAFTFGDNERCASSGTMPPKLTRRGRNVSKARDIWWIKPSKTKWR